MRDPGPAALAAEGARGAGHGRAGHRRQQRLRARRARREPGRGAAAGLPAADHPHGAAGPTSRRWPPARWPSRVVSLADTISTASAFAARTGQEVHGNQEMIGIGAANLAAGLFQGFPVSTSASRTAVAERAGATTQLTGVIGAALIIADDRAAARSVPEPAPGRAGRGGDHGVAVAGRPAGHGPAVASAQGRVHSCRSSPSSASRCSACCPAS